MAKVADGAKLAIDIALASLKSLRAGTYTVQAFSQDLKAIDDGQLAIFSEISRMKLTMVQQIRNIAAL